jgi:nucleoside-diphosphate-sugar epimerase
MFDKSAAKPFGGGGVLAPILETQPLLPDSHLTGPYCLSKAAAERMVLAANGPKLRTLAMRPGGVYGPKDQVRRLG